MLNFSVDVQNIYDVYLNSNTLGKIAFVTSKESKLNKYFGIYNALIYIEGNKSQIIKYAYVKDLENSIRWPIYSLNFVIDIDQDENGFAELVVFETYENNISCNILKYENNKFYEVLKTNIIF